MKSARVRCLRTPNEVIVVKHNDVLVSYGARDTFILFPNTYFFLVGVNSNYGSMTSIVHEGAHWSVTVLQMAVKTDLPRVRTHNLRHHVTSKRAN